MKVDLVSDFPVTDAACRKATQKTMKQWFVALDEQPDLNRKRRDAITWLHAEMHKDLWWPTTIWVEYERHHGIVNRKDGRIEGFNICVTKTVAVPVSRTCSAWTDPKIVTQWLGTGCRMDLRDGGRFDDGDGHTGEFLRLRPDKDLRFSWNDALPSDVTQVDVSFADKGKGKTGITLNHQRIQTREEADGLRKAWGTAFETLKTLLEG